MLRCPSCMLAHPMSPHPAVRVEATVAQSSVNSYLGVSILGLSLVEQATTERQRADFPSRHLIVKDEWMLGSNATSKSRDI